MLGVYDMVRLNPACIATETSKYIEILHLASLAIINKGADQTAWMYMLVYAFVIGIEQNQAFSQRGPYNLFAC